MENSDDTSIDVEYLVTSLRGELEKLNPLTDDCCIYKVPQSIRRLNEALFTPRVVSIGPLHHGREELIVMEEHKKRYLKYFLQRTNLSLEYLITFMKKKEPILRNCFSETISFGSDEFVKIVLVDAIFVLELLLRGGRELHDSDYRIFTKPYKGGDIVWFDILLLENQLPMFILEDLLELAKTADSPQHAEISMVKLAREFCGDIDKLVFVERDSLEEHCPNAKHFLDLMRLCFKPSKSCHEKLENLTTPTITELHQAGVKFETGSSNHLFDIEFTDRNLKIPKLIVKLGTETFFRNMQVFESLHCDTNYVNDYIIIMNYLVNTPKDVELLVQDGIIENWLWGSEGVSTMFQNLRKEGVVLNDFYYVDTIKKLNTYCKVPWHRWKASLKQNYFNTPWASISVAAAVILLILTLIQTVFSAIKE